MNTDKMTYEELQAEADRQDKLERQYEDDAARVGFLNRSYSSLKQEAAVHRAKARDLRVEASKARPAPREARGAA